MSEDERDRYDIDVSELYDVKPCEFCQGAGVIAVEQDSSLRYPCPDCA